MHALPARASKLYFFITLKINEIRASWALGCKTSPVYAETMRDLCGIAGLLKLLECQAKIHTSPNCTQNALWGS